MSDEIRAGDVCEIVGHCCEENAPIVGNECTVVAVGCGYCWCSACRFHSQDSVRVHLDLPRAWGANADGSFNIARAWLRKKPPKPYADFTPANADDWPSTHWHPNRTTVKA